MPTDADPSRHRNIVLDASAAYVLLMDPGEPGDRIAARLSGTHVAAPALLPFEVSNVLRRQWSAGHLTRSEAATALDDFHDLAVKLWPFAALHPRVWELGGSMTSYDAAYVALAELLDATLVTSDARLSRSNGARCPIEVY
ncbi:type II toxin-antitoxin system VapC family toxin [Isoptericola croceus]|uniref:type II toxin-antitoxin system VapC family toxin n=1 Tax=Isoptericola croceus TaxID=3031406 RepID=UPI0023F7C19A|nr:type II toxin-antitoxin system VapC family toxin [Isoptericola croceus]